MTDAEMRAALDEREALIETRADVVLNTALTENASWTKAFGTPPSDEHQAAAWRRTARVVAASRDRYRITSQTPLGPEPATAAQKIDAARARAAFDRVLRLSEESLTSAAGLQAARRSQAQTGRSM